MMPQSAVSSIRLNIGRCLRISLRNSCAKKGQPPPLIIRCRAWACLRLSRLLTSSRFFAQILFKESFFLCKLYEAQCAPAVSMRTTQKACTLEPLLLYLGGTVEGFAESNPGEVFILLSWLMEDLCRGVFQTMLEINESVRKEGVRDRWR